MSADRLLGRHGGCEVEEREEGCMQGRGESWHTALLVHLRVAIFYFDTRTRGGWGRPEAAEFDGSHPLTSSLLDIPRTLCFFLSATKVVFWSVAAERIRIFFF